MIAHDAPADLSPQLMDKALPAIALLEARLAEEREAKRLSFHSASFLDSLTSLNQAIVQERESLRLAVQSASLLDALTSLNHAILKECDQMDAIDLISPRLWEYEEFHSRIVSWLLNPSAHHRQAGHFISALLNATMAPSQLLSADWSVAQVRQEWENVVDGQWGYLDILILNQEYQGLIAIENKIFSQEHSNQLTRYRRALADAYPDFTRHHIFLSPAGISPYLERDQRYWQPASYSIIHDAIQQGLEKGIADPDANALLQIYSTTIRRNVMSDTSLEQQARRIYLEHREALDIIFANKPNWIGEIKPMLKEAVAKHSFWKLDREYANYVYFRAADWDEFPSSKTGTGLGSQSNALLPFEFSFYDERPLLALALSPADPNNVDIRAALFDAARQNPSIFKSPSNSLTEGWMILHKEPECILEPADYGLSWDDGAARRKIEAWIDKFAEEQFPEMNRIIVDCLRRHQET